jgi:hypothetical protein
MQSASMALRRNSEPEYEQIEPFLLPSFSQNHVHWQQHTEALLLHDYLKTKIKDLIFGPYRKMGSEGFVDATRSEVTGLT